MKTRQGFTLVEILVVVGILVLLSTLTLTVLGGRSSDKTRSAARVVQSALLGAKDRAVHAHEIRGVRLIRDEQNPQLVTGFAYVGPIQHDAYPVQSIHLERLDLIDNATGSPGPDGLADSQDVQIVRGFGTDWNALQSRFTSPPMVRIPAVTGKWYQCDTSMLGPNSEVLRMVTPYTYGIESDFPSVVACSRQFDSTNSCEVRFSNDAMPFSEPIPLPSGTVIDLRYSSPVPAEVMFSPRGEVAGIVGSLYFVLRELTDTQYDPTDSRCSGECLIVTPTPSTGLVATYPADLHSGNLFSFAQAGKAAGR